MVKRITSKKSIFVWAVLALFFISNQAMALVSGQQIWERHYKGQNLNRINAHSYASKAAVDKNDNVIIAGSDANGIALIKYKPNGKKLWIKKYNEAIDSYMYVTALNTDSSGNIYMAIIVIDFIGLQEAYLIKYDSAGNRKWKKNFFEINDITIDNKDNVILSAGSILVKYSQNGSEKWLKNVSYYYHKSRVDSNDNVYVAGQRGSSLVISKYDDTGNQKWQKYFNIKMFAGMNRYLGVSVDEKNNFIIAGDLISGEVREVGDEVIANTDYFVTKYSTAGKQKWIRYFDSGIDRFSQLTLDSSENIYLTGTSESKSASKFRNKDISTVKFDGQGNRRWARKYDSGYDHYALSKWSDNWRFTDQAMDVFVNSKNGVYIAGNIYNGPTRKTDSILIKYDSQGKQRWARKYNGSSSNHDMVQNMVSDSLENVYVTGSSNINNYQGYWYKGTIGDFTLLKYAP